MQPGGQRLPRTYRGCFERQDQERRLESILRGAHVAQDAPAHVKHQRAMPVYQRGKSPLVSFRDETTEQGGVGGFVRFGLNHQPADISEQSVGARCHDGGSRATWEDDGSSLPIYCPTTHETAHGFFTSTAGCRRSLNV